MSVKNGDLLRLEELLDRVTEDKKRLSHRVNKLMANGKNINTKEDILHKIWKHTRYKMRTENDLSVVLKK